jgi:hypothetical protein
MGTVGVWLELNSWLNWSDQSWWLGLSHSLDHSFHQTLEGASLLAQSASTLKSIDILADFQNAFKNFIESGQVWALSIGLVIGWVLHSFIGS